MRDDGLFPHGTVELCNCSDKISSHTKNWGSIMDGSDNFGISFFVTALLVMEMSFFLVLYVTEWIASKPAGVQRRYRMSAQAMLVAISLAPLLMSMASAPAWAKDLLTLTPETTAAHGVIDSETVQSEVNLPHVPSVMAAIEFRPFGPTSRNARLYRRLNNVEMIITLDTSLRTSLINRIIPNPWKNDWSYSTPGFKEKKTIRERKVFAYTSKKVHPINLSRTDQGLPQTFISHSMSFSQPSTSLAVSPYLRDSNGPVLAQFLHVKPLPRTQTFLLPSSSPWDREYMPFSIVLDVQELFGA